jgi:hypothetical protein
MPPRAPHPTTTTVVHPNPDANVATGASTGAAAGAVGGGLLGLLAGLAIPGVGPLIAAGPLVAALMGTAVGAGAGAATGGLIAALTGAGVPEEEATYYEEGVRRGGTLVTVTADDALADRAASTLSRFGAINMAERAAAWRQSGWTYDAPPRPQL